MSFFEFTLLVCFAGVVVAWLLVYAAHCEQRRRRLALERWLRGHLFLIRANCASSSEEAISVVNSLERALPVLAPIDCEELERHLYALRRQRDCRLLKQVTALQAAPEDPTRKGWRL